MSEPTATTGQEIAALREDMLRFAVLQLRDRPSAEDAVQEALAAALAAQRSFEGRAALKTWVFSILRHKLIDLLRERRRHPSEALPEEDAGIEASQFDGRGHWRPETTPGDWGEPEAAFASGQFWAVFEACLNVLPAATARVFMMRELLGLETAEICAELAISQSNCWVVLHRARLGLRACLSDNWFTD